MSLEERPFDKSAEPIWTPQAGRRPENRSRAIRVNLSRDFPGNTVNSFAARKCRYSREEISENLPQPE